MSEYIINKENEIFHLMITIPFPQINTIDKKIHKSNLPLRIINNKYGKIIVACDAHPSVSQVILSNLDLFKNTEHINYNYLKEYITKINKIVSDLSIFINKTYFYIVVIAEGKSYCLWDNGYIKEDNTLLSTENLAAFYNGNFNLEINHGKEFLLKVFNMYSVINGQPNSYVYVNTKTFKPIIMKGTKL